MCASSGTFRHRGYSDQPTCEDALGMADKYKGLAKFICECETPMTIAINGDWGSGKSSAMRIIQQHLKQYAGDDVERQIILFNTWEFSIISDNSKLVFELLQTLNEKLGQLEDLYGEPPKTAVDTGRLLAAIGGMAKGAALGVLEESGIKLLLDMARGAGEMLTGAADKTPSSKAFLDPYLCASPTRLLRSVSGQIQRRIANIVTKVPNLPRLFIFIDDLDRLEPGVALELIEGMKNFAAYENCVFVLAVDQSVVERGLKSKYGNEISDEMAQHFFDKIIQLPFQLPVNAYKLSSYVQSLLEKSAIALDSAGALAENLAVLLKKFGITNPRTIKRSFNMLQMYQCMNDIKDEAAGVAPTALAGGELIEQYYKQYAVLLLALASPADHAKMAQLVDSGCSYTDSGDLQRIQEAFQNLRREKDGETYSRYIAAVLDAFYTEGGDHARATKELADTLTFTKTDDIDHDRYALAQFLLRLLSRLERAPENEEAIRDCECWERVAHASSPYALAKRNEKIVIELQGLAEGCRLRIIWEPFQQFFISLYSAKITQEYLTSWNCFHFLDDSGAPETEEGFNCYHAPGRVTVFVSDTKNADRLLRVMDDCGVFGTVE